MALLITCPNCGSRAYTEYWFGGELPAPSAPQGERWFHFAGCRRWLTVERDTRTNVVHAGD